MVAAWRGGIPSALTSLKWAFGVALFLVPALLVIFLWRRDGWGTAHGFEEHRRMRMRSTDNIVVAGNTVLVALQYIAIAVGRMPAGEEGSGADGDGAYPAIVRDFQLVYRWFVLSGMRVEAAGNGL